MKSNKIILNTTIIIFVNLLFFGVILSFSESSASIEKNEKILINEANIINFDPRVFHPVEKPLNLNPDEVSLGERLFNDKRFSRDNTISCATCHDFNKGGADGNRTAIGIEGKVGTLNTPTVFNSSLNFTQFWDGRALTLESQVKEPVHNPVEMDSNWNDVLSKLRLDDNYIMLFNSLYPEGLTINNIIDAIAVFERSLISINSKFDQYLNGDLDALTIKQKKGMARFMMYGCHSCHQGVNIGGNMFQRLGVMESYYNEKNTNQANMGRYNITKKDEDRYVFKVPGLRNVAITPPYLHNGSIDKLEDVVSLMGRYQLGRNLPDEDIDSITEFLQSLTGEWKGKSL